MDKVSGYSARLHVRLYEWQRKLIDQAAAIEGVKASDLVRAVMTDVCRRRIARAEADEGQ